MTQYLTKTERDPAMNSHEWGIEADRLTRANCRRYLRQKNAAPGQPEPEPADRVDACSRAIVDSLKQHGPNRVRTLWKAIGSTYEIFNAAVKRLKLSGKVVCKTGLGIKLAGLVLLFMTGCTSQQIQGHGLFSGRQDAGAPRQWPSTGKAIGKQMQAAAEARATAVQPQSPKARWTLVSATPTNGGCMYDVFTDGQGPSVALRAMEGVPSTAPSGATEGTHYLTNTICPPAPLVTLPLACTWGKATTNGAILGKRACVMATTNLGRSWYFVQYIEPPGTNVTVPNNKPSEHFTIAWK